MLEHQVRLAPWLAGVDPAQAASAANLAHYLAMRRYDMRQLQDKLSLIGVSSLGRAETHVMANLDKVLGLLHLLTGQHWVPMTADEPVGFRSGRALLDRHAEALFGPPPAERPVRIMVTLPSEAAHDGALVEALVANGMDIARINCAHDGPVAWEAMAERVRRAGRRSGRPVRVLMDLAGPKLRTGPLPAAPVVLRIRPQRDDHGRVTAPARLWLHALGADASAGGAQPRLGVDAAWLDALRPGDRIVCDDARDARRHFTVVDKQPDGAWVECRRTVYLAIETRLQRQRGGRAGPDTAIGDLPPATPRLLLQRGDKLRLHAVDAVIATPAAGRQRRPTVAAIGCTLPEALAQVRKGERLWFDDGRLGGVVTRRVARGVEIEITHARDGGEWLAADKGINLPDTRLELPALTAKDLEDLATVARCADLVGLSFAQSAADVRALRARLADHGVPDLGLVLKIETRRGFEHLPEMLFAAMAGPSVGRHDRARRPRGGVRLRAPGRGPGGDPVGLRGGAPARGLGDAGAGDAGQDGTAVARRDHRRGDGRARRVRDAQQGPAHPGRHAHARRHPASHAGPPVEEAAAAAGAEVLGRAAGGRGGRAAAARRRQQGIAPEAMNRPATGASARRKAPRHRENGSRAAGRCCARCPCERRRPR